MFGMLKNKMTISPDHLRGRLVGPIVPPSPREQVALDMHWKDYVRLDDIKMFLWMEGMYTIQLCQSFHMCNHEEEKEEIRLQILEKRKEWLLFWLKNIYHQ